MERCLIKNCLNTSPQCSFFKFPFEDCTLLKKWLEKIPKNLYTVIEGKSTICENHFDKQLLIFKNGCTQLRSSAVPTIFHDLEHSVNPVEDDAVTDNSICRFCLRILQDEEKQIAINAYIRKQFFAITQSELSKSQTLSLIICEMCFDSTRDLANFRSKLLENQQILEGSLVEHETIIESDSPPQEIFLSPPPKLEIPEPNILKIEPTFDEEEIVVMVKEDFYEEHLDPDLLHEQKNFFEFQRESKEFEPKKLKEKKKVKEPLERNKLCSDCGKSYSNQAFKRHFERVHLRLKNYHCDYCSYKTYSRSHIEIHVRSHLKIKTFSCEQCGAFFGSGNILRQHFLTHQVERPYNCEFIECQLTFKSIYALRRHMKTHGEDRLRFECDECGAKFSDKWHLKRHKVGHQTESHPCEICGKVFGTEMRLKSHQIYHRPPQFQCEICKKDFYKKPDLTSHFKTHTGQKDFQCKFCPNSYYKNSHLNRHLATHTKTSNL